MGRNFNASQYVACAPMPTNTRPFTMACWFRPATAHDGSPMAVTDDGTLLDAYAMFYGGSSQAGKVGAIEYTGGTLTAIALTSTAVTVGAWTHGAVTFNSATSRSAFLNGASKGSDTASSTPGVTDRFFLGTVTGVFWMNGDIAEAGMWNVTLTDAEIAELASGIKPIYIRPSALIAYWPVAGNITAEPDVKGIFHLTLASGTIAAKSDNPPVIGAPERTTNMGQYLDVGNGMSRSERLS